MKGSCFVFLLLTGLLFLLAARPGQRPWFHTEPRNKRIFLVADIAYPHGSTGPGAALHGSFVVLAPVKRNLWATPLQKNQFATSPSCCFCYSGAASCCSCYGWFCFFVFVVPRRKHCACQLLKYLYFQQVRENSESSSACLRGVFVTALPRRRYAGASR